MAAKLSDAEFIERARASAKRRADRQRLRKLESGKVQTNHWLPANAKARLDTLATELNASPSEVVTAAILAYVPPTTRPALPVDAKDVPESLPLFEPVPTEPAQPNRDAAIIAAHAQGLSLNGIIKALADQGIVTIKGNPISRDTVNQVLKKAHLQPIRERG